MSIFDLIFIDENFRSVKVLRALRPIYYISYQNEMRIILKIINKSVYPILNVALIIFGIWFMLAIIGSDFFGGKFFFCSVHKYSTKTKEECF